MLARLEREGLKPSPEADARTLIRRVSFDLTGLPPTPAEVDAFLRDTSPDAYEKVVDRLLASPRYGERMAMRWLDAARYADTNGYQTDAERYMWRWRDWVIDAFNRNLPYDRFTVEQIAGDLLPGATRDQMIATGFNRNHRGNGEGGIIPEEYAVEYVVDRVDTTSTVWMGLTLGCARCHNHKYDPFTQKEFYQLFAYFNQVPERGNAFKYGNSPPSIAAPLPEQEARLKSLEQRLAAAEQQVRGDGAANPAGAGSVGAIGCRDDGRVDWAPSRAVAVNLPLAGDLSGEITPDPPRSEKYLYLMENGPVRSAVAFTGKAAVERRRAELRSRSDRAGRRVRWQALRRPRQRRELRLLRFASPCRRGSIPPQRPGRSSAARSTNPRARVSACSERRTSGREPGAALARRWRPRGERSGRAAEPLVPRDASPTTARGWRAACGSTWTAARSNQKSIWIT